MNLKNLKKIWTNRALILEGLYNSIITNEDIENLSEHRMSICNKCPHIDKEGSKCVVPGTQPCCGLCGCSLSLKTKSPSSSCDDERWDKVMSESEEDMLNNNLNKQ